MTHPRRFNAELKVDGRAISGIVTDQHGYQQPFDGWLALIGLLQPEDPGTSHRDGLQPPRQTKVDARHRPV